jgi:hypothetical protein
MLIRQSAMLSKGVERHGENGVVVPPCRTRLVRGLNLRIGLYLAARQFGYHQKDSRFSRALLLEKPLGTKG